MNASAGLIADKNAEDFYQDVLIGLQNADIPFLVGGAYAFICYTGITRPTKDLDIFIRRKDYDRLNAALADTRYKVDLTYPHWLAKIHFGDEFVDVIFNSGNGIAEVDDAWFERSHRAEVLGLQTCICPVEETIWSKAFIMERERYDGADIVHMLRACSGQIDWRHLLDRFGDHWRVLLIHLTAFGFVYPAERNLVPLWVMDELLDRLRTETHTPPPHGALCAGPLLSREQYLTDIRNWGYQDARVIPVGNMTPDETARWTDAIQQSKE
ncbi:hypothetical protein Q8A64_02710 [Oxalobacteraceae bacterium R-40]|uniref:Nucleotidyltransferase-like protein n=1 Tax=Keguizhuia sedimenti TaxID=3064264 RepID=A0ABU1BJX9_9BURK|nr:hypothetical protein [Oxalobacteraceae bacterium R-40]